ncbi:MAG: HAD family hydrolase [Paracoccaceae bacterium]
MDLNVRGIVFDKDGTLFEFGATWEAWANSFLMRATNGDRVRAIDAGKSVGFDLAAQRFLPSSIVVAGTVGEVAEAFAPHFPEYDQIEILKMLNAEAEHAPQVEAVPLDPFLSNLTGRGIKLGIATNDGINPAMAHLKSAGIIGHFKFIAGYDSGHGGKPDPGQLLAFCKHTKLAPKECVMVGDSLHDLCAGQAAGMRTIGVLTGVAGADDLEPYADVVMPDVGHILAWLDANATGEG